LSPPSRINKNVDRSRYLKSRVKIVSSLNTKYVLNFSRAALEKKPAPKERIRQEYLAFESVKNWLNGVATASEYTKRFYLSDLIEYCTWTKKNPDEVIQERKKQLRSRDQDVRMTAERMLKEYANSGLKSANRMWRIVGSIKSFYKHNFYELTPAAVRAPKRPKVKDYRIPTTDDVRKMLEGSSLRDRAILLTLYQTGLRESSLVQLKLKHIKELFEGKSPVHIGLRSQELKGTYAGLEAHTFLGRDAIEAIKRYLDWRKNVKREALTDDSYLFTKLDAVGQPINELATIAVVQNACIRAGTGIFSPHDFRRATQTALEGAGISANWVKRIMGHKLSGSENPYSQPQIEQLREAYMKAEPKLSITIKAESDFDRVKKELDSLRERLKLSTGEFQKHLQKVYPNLKPIDWFTPQPRKEATPEEIKAYEDAVREMDRQLLKQEILEELGITKSEKGKKTMTNGNGQYESKIVQEKELTEYLNEAWEFVASLNHDKYLVRRALDR